MSSILVYSLEKLVLHVLANCSVYGYIDELVGSASTASTYTVAPWCCRMGVHGNQARTGSVRD